MKVLLEGLPKAGFDQLSQPDGAFYLYCDVTSLLAKSGTRDSLALCTKLLQEAAVATTSGLDFDPEVCEAPDPKFVSCAPILT